MGDIIQPKVHGLISKYKLPYFCMSAKTGYNVVETFMTVTTAFMRNIAQKHLDSLSSSSSSLKNKKKSRKKSKHNKVNKRSYYREESMSREESITIASTDCDFSKEPMLSKSSGCC